uniref:Transposase n=1 Tax=Macrostomum lignano TaxID=282301 RepID=A0A1I8GL18_9PLAT
MPDSVGFSDHNYCRSVSHVQENIIHIYGSLKIIENPIMMNFYLLVKDTESPSITGAIRHSIGTDLLERQFGSNL